MGDIYAYPENATEIVSPRKKVVENDNQSDFFVDKPDLISKI